MSISYITGKGTQIFIQLVMTAVIDSQEVEILLLIGLARTNPGQYGWNWADPLSGLNLHILFKIFKGLGGIAIVEAVIFPCLWQMVLINIIF